ncbi:lysozyme [Mucilaginibacter kameinonensis]|uniref:lysozyme n=1 Tax=Mucilaginibacter kameinonensis TaxID=452286 RepID=UPI0013CEC8F1|nr:lysozyme [Mucilaginibacter kameinonensis]
MKIDKDGIKFISNQEGVRLKAYKDIVGVWTIGIGCTYYPDGTPVKQGDVITPAQCDELFSKVVSTYEKAVTTAIKVSLNQNQFNALVSLAFNIGTVGFGKSTLAEKINAGATLEEIRAAFNLWNKAGGKINSTLVKRRKDEADLYLKPKQ